MTIQLLKGSDSPLPLGEGLGEGVASITTDPLFPLFLFSSISMLRTLTLTLSQKGEGT